MIAIVTQGYFLGLAYAMPIGAQNMFVINSAVQQSKMEAFRTALIVAAMDISLGVACILGMGQILNQFSRTNSIMGVLGGIFMVWIGLSLVLTRVTDVVPEREKIATTALRTAFILTWLNPHALIDGSIILGGIQTSFQPNHIIFFMVGMGLASISWFLTLTTVVRYFRRLISGPALRWINVICGLALITLGIQLSYGVFKNAF